IYRLITNGSYNSVPNRTSLCACSKGQRTSHCSRTHIASTGFCSTALNSWIYPQSTLPLSLMSVLTSPAAEKVEMDFLKKRQLSWEESFRSLYYLFRKNLCSVFYVCTSQFVVMFTADGDSGRSKRTCSAYVSRSTRDSHQPQGAEEGCKGDQNRGFDEDSEYEAFEGTGGDMERVT
ncbi:hypothetical protein NL676_038805, partial [Syzygium grande]